MTETAGFWLPVVWALLAATAIFLYICLDGFDLGIGILFLKERTTITATSWSTPSPLSGTATRPG